VIRSEELYQIFKKFNLSYFTGVPDSTFKGWMSFLDRKSRSGNLTNRIAANECEAVFLAGSYYIATGNFGVVYMQNAGLGKAVNPITSYADGEVYNIPMLLMIGWRGEPGVTDEPQHKKMGRITKGLLEVLEIPYKVVPDDILGIEDAINEACRFMREKSSVYAILVRKDLVDDEPGIEYKRKYSMLREEALKLILENLSESDFIVSTTGKTSRELWEYRESQKQSHGHDFLNIGGMGGVTSQALEIALQKPSRRIFAFDGDGSVLMQMGSLATIGHYMPRNLYHIVFDNNSHESTGGQPTVSDTIEFEKVALASGYRTASVVDTREGLLKEIKGLKEGPAMIVVKINKGSRKELGRPTIPPQSNKENFMKTIGGDDE
jgi:phosphonopyruvate decarboxylase